MSVRHITEYLRIVIDEIDERYWNQTKESEISVRRKQERNLELPSEEHPHSRTAHETGERAGNAFEKPRVRLK